MKSSISTGCATVFIFAVTGLVSTADTVLAQQQSAEMEEIVVQAPIEIARRQIPRASSPTASTEIIELKRNVSFDDLDLADHNDVQELESRIAAVARESCEQLSAMFEHDGSDETEVQRCTRRAIDSTLAQKEQAIAAAR